MKHRFASQSSFLAEDYTAFFETTNYTFVQGHAQTDSNYWLNVLILEDREQRDTFLQETNNEGVMTCSVWSVMHHLELYANVQRGDLSVAEWLEFRIVNMPSSVYIGGDEDG